MSFRFKWWRAQWIALVTTISSSHSSSSPLCASYGCHQFCLTTCVSASLCCCLLLWLFPCLLSPSVMIALRSSALILGSCYAMFLWLAGFKNADMLPQYSFVKNDADGLGRVHFRLFQFLVTFMYLQPWSSPWTVGQNQEQVSEGREVYVYRRELVDGCKNTL